MLAFLATGWGRAAAGLILASVMLAGIATFGVLERRAGRQDAVLESTTQALRNAEVRHDIEDDLRRHPAGAAERLRAQWSRD